MVDAFVANGGEGPGLVLLDEDDAMLGGYYQAPRPRNWAMVQAGRATLSERYNWAFAAFGFADWYGFLADDVVPETPGFEKMLVEAAGSDGMAFGDDGINGGDHATHFVLGGDLVREFGFLSLPGLSRLYIDTVWNDIAISAKRRYYLPHVKLTHRHFSNGKALMDSTYKKPAKAADRAIYETWRAGNGF
jgi:hypothetical protein